MAKTGPQQYPGASQAYRYQGVYGGDSMESNVIVWHTTEGTSLPAYDGGGEAPNFTAVPDFKAKRLVWYQHFDFDTSSRALVNKAGGVETNTLNVCQIEIVGTCDPATHKKWGSTPHLYTPELPDWAIRDLAAFAKWANEQHGVPLFSGLTFKAYPGSYGNSDVRMTAARWNAFRGHCGHQHVPENLHGDPGAFPMAEILAAAKGGTTTPSEEDDMAPTPLQFWAYRNEKQDAAAKKATGKGIPDAYGYLVTMAKTIEAMAATVEAQGKKIDALTAALTDLTKHLKES